MVCVREEVQRVWLNPCRSPPLCASVRQQWYVYEEIECFEMHLLIPYAHKKKHCVCVLHECT
jgi:hypothetical protein